MKNKLPICATLRKELDEISEMKIFCGRYDTEIFIGNLCKLQTLEARVTKILTKFELGYRPNKQTLLKHMDNVFVNVIDVFCDICVDAPTQKLFCYLSDIVSIKNIEYRVCLKMIDDNNYYFDSNFLGLSDN